MGSFDMTSVKQPTARPTNKLTAAIVATALTETARVTLDTFWPNTFDGPFWLAISPVVVFAVGYFIKDEDNTP
jgi:hypothetical protein